MTSAPAFSAPTTTMSNIAIATGLGLVTFIIVGLFLFRHFKPPIQQDKDGSDEESGSAAIRNAATSQATHPGQLQEPADHPAKIPAKSNLPQSELSSDSHVPSRLPSTDRNKYQKKVAMAQEATAANVKKQSGEDTTGT